MKATGMFGLLARVSWQAFTKEVQLPPQVLLAFPVTHPSLWVANAFPHCRGGGRVVQAVLVVPPALVTPPAATPPVPMAPPFEPLLPPAFAPPVTVLPPEELVALPPEATLPPFAEVAPPAGPAPAPPLLVDCAPPEGPPVAPPAAELPPAAPPAPPGDEPPDPLGGVLGPAQPGAIVTASTSNPVIRRS